MRGCAVLEDAETDAIEAGAEEVNVIDEKSGTLEFVSPDNDLVTVKGCLVKAGYECQDASIAYFPNVEATPNGIEKMLLDVNTNEQEVKKNKGKDLIPDKAEIPRGQKPAVIMSWMVWKLTRVTLNLMLNLNLIN